MYNLNEKLMIEEFNKNVVAVKQDSLAIEKLYMLKDSNRVHCKYIQREMGHT